MISWLLAHWVASSLLGQMHFRLLFFCSETWLQALGYPCSCGGVLGSRVSHREVTIRVFFIKFFFTDYWAFPPPHGSRYWDPLGSVYELGVGAPQIRIFKLNSSPGQLATCSLSWLMLARLAALLIIFYLLWDLVGSSRLPLLMWGCAGAQEWAIGKLHLEFFDQIFFHKPLGLLLPPKGLGIETP